MRIITTTEIEEMANTILDEDTGMTALDLAEWQGQCEDWFIIKDW